MAATQKPLRPETGAEGGAQAGQREEQLRERIQDPPRCRSLGAKRWRQSREEREKVEGAGPQCKAEAGKLLGGQADSRWIPEGSLISLAPAGTAVCVSAITQLTWAHPSRHHSHACPPQLLCPAPLGDTRGPPHVWRLSDMKITADLGAEHVSCGARLPGLKPQLCAQSPVGVAETRPLFPSAE